MLRFPDHLPCLRCALGASQEAQYLSSLILKDNISLDFMLLIQQYLWPPGILEFQNFGTPEKILSTEVTEPVADLKMVCVLLPPAGCLFCTLIYP